MLSIENLTLSYETPSGLRPAVRGVDLLIQRGSVHGLVGESGCGKSSLALAAMGFRPGNTRITAGRVSFDGHDLLRLPVARLRSIWGKQIAYVPQNPGGALNPAVAIGRQITECLRRHRGLTRDAANTHAASLLETVGLPHGATVLDRLPHEFSGGQKQRVALALALACEPDVLILDEPTTGLDVTTQAMIVDLLRRRIRGSQIAVLFVTHDLALISSLADELSVMYAGEIVETGLCEDVIRRPGHPYTRALLSAVPRVDEARLVRGLRGSPPDNLDGSGCSFAPRCRWSLQECIRTDVQLVEVRSGQTVRCIRSNEPLAESRPASIPEPTASMVEEKLVIEGLTCVHRGRGPELVAVRDLSLRVMAGETLGIVGESGSGKSTLLRAIIGLHVPAAGEIRLGSQVLEGAVAQRSRRTTGEIQMVFQNPTASLNPMHTVAQAVLRPLKLFRPELSRKEQNARVAELLERVQLPLTLLDRLPAQLSGGQLQRVALARAFASKPSVLLCDEVTSALDVSVQAGILELVRELAQNLRVAVVFVSHDLAVVRTVAQRVIIMRDGSERESGVTSAVFSQPKDVYTRELLAAIPSLRKRIDLVAVAPSARPGNA